MEDFVRERNVFIPAAPIRRSFHKKLHKVSHQFSCGHCPCKIVRTVQIFACKINQNSLREFSKERNLFLQSTPIRRALQKKLHKVLHQSIFATFVAR